MVILNQTYIEDNNDKKLNVGVKHFGVKYEKIEIINISHSFLANWNSVKWCVNKTFKK